MRRNKLPDPAFDSSKVFHWGYVVPNMERALNQWLRMGATLVVSPTLDPIQNVVCSLLIFRDAVTIELVAPNSSGPNPLGSRLAKGGGLDHVCLFSDDLETDLAELRASAGVVVVEPSYGAVFDRELAFVVMRVGLVIELMTRKAVGRLAIDPLSPYWS